MSRTMVIASKTMRIWFLLAVPLILAGAAGHGDGLSQLLLALVVLLPAFLMPLFFVQMGLKIDIVSLFRLDVLALASVLTIAAIAGKQACGLGALGRNLSRVAIGVGMIPRGEVGLIFAGIGLSLMVDGRRILDEAVFSAILIMVMVTTLVTPPLLQWSLSRVTEER